MKSLEWIDPLDGCQMYSRLNADGTTSIMTNVLDNVGEVEMWRLPVGITVARVENVFAPIEERVLVAPNASIEPYGDDGEYLYIEAGVKSFVYTGKKYPICARAEAL